MADGSAIEWTDATWNPIAGCSIVSPGCTNCYAMKMAARIEKMGSAPHYAGLTQPSKAGPVWTGKVVQAPDHILTQPLRWKKPRRIFVNSMSDLFHENLPDEVIDKVFAVMALARRHTFQVLTKRSTRMRSYMADLNLEGRWMGAVADLFEIEPATMNACYPVMGQREPWLPLPNVWLGLSVEDQERADERIPDLLATPAAVRFLSCEPLLGPVDLTHVQAPRFVPDDHDLDWKFNALATGDYFELESNGFWSSGDGPYREARIDWVIAGGESGHGARPSQPDWYRSLRDECASAGVSFFMKQMTKKAAIPDDLMVREFPNANA